MTFEIGFLFALIAVMVYLFLTEKLPVAKMLLKSPLLKICST